VEWRRRRRWFEISKVGKAKSVHVCTYACGVANADARGIDDDDADDDARLCDAMGVSMYVWSIYGMGAGGARGGTGRRARASADAGGRRRDALSWSYRMATASSERP